MEKGKYKQPPKFPLHEDWEFQGKNEDTLNVELMVNMGMGLVQQL
jgi:hypothetical protein